MRVHNLAPGNAGVIFDTNILLPVMGFVLFWLEYRCTRDSAFAKMSSREIPDHETMSARTMIRVLAPSPKEHDPLYA
jgi:hypothetical protein